MPSSSRSIEYASFIRNSRPRSSPEPGTELVAVLPLDLIDVHRQVAVGRQIAGRHQGDDLFLRGAEDQVAIVAIHQLEEVVPVQVVAAGRSPRVGRKDDRHAQLAANRPRPSPHGRWPRSCASSAGRAGGSCTPRTSPDGRTHRAARGGGSRSRRRPDPRAASARTVGTGAWVPQDSGTRRLGVVDAAIAQQAQSPPDADARDDLDVATGLAEPHAGASVGPALAPRAPAAPGRRSGVPPFPRRRSAHGSDGTDQKERTWNRICRCDPVVTSSTRSRPSGRWSRCGRSCWPTSRRPSGCSPRSPATAPDLILESVERSERWGRYSFVAGDPAADRGRRRRRACGSTDVVRPLPVDEPSPPTPTRGRR